MHKLLLAVLASALAFASAAQTGRIAHFSHSGSAATLTVEKKSGDNFGTPVSYFEVDSIRYISASKALEYGKWRYCSDCKDRKNPVVLVLNPKMQAAEAARYFRQGYYHKMPKLLGFDSINSPAQGRRKPKRDSGGKPSGRSQALPQRPFQYSYWRELASAAALGAVGWLLGKKRVA